MISDHAPFKLDYRHSVLPECTSELQGCKFLEQCDGEKRDEGHRHQQTTVDQRGAVRHVTRLAQCKLDYQVKLDSQESNNNVSLQPHMFVVTHSVFT